ncbi:MAG: peptide deformylase [Bacillota bacterium]
MPVREILLLGNPRLYETSLDLKPSDIELIQSTVEDLHDTLMDFRKKFGLGRAIAAPQIGVMKRLIYMHIDAPTVIINPFITLKSKEMMEVWDDCMSFPELFVKVYRHRECRINFLDLNWQETHLDLKGDLSELLQHEYDHLDGILAVSRAINGRSFCLRRQNNPLTGRTMKI